MNGQGEVAAGFAVNAGGFMIDDFGDYGAEHGVFILCGGGLRIGVNNSLHARNERLPGLIGAEQLVE